jgi:hypothetical protein
MSMPKALAASDVYISAYRRASDATRLFGCIPRLCHVTTTTSSADVVEGIREVAEGVGVGVAMDSKVVVQGELCPWADTALLRERLLSPLGPKEADTTRNNKQAA